MNEHEHQARPLDAPEPVGTSPADSPVAVGARLRAAREATGLPRDEFARRAHMPTAVLVDLEEGRFERLGAAVYVRGYLRSAARAAGVPEAELAPARLAEPDTAMLQVAPRPAPIAPRWLTRYATPVAYALLTAVVMVPLVYLARPSAQQLAQVPSLTPIDSNSASLVASAPFAPPAAPPAEAAGAVVVEGPPAPGPDEADALLAAAPAVEPAIEAPAIAQASDRPSPQQPVMASLAPMPATADGGRAAQRVTLRLRDASWVEFTGSDGRRLEYALLPAGTTREYRLTGRAELRVGNSTGAELSIDGQPVPLPVPAGSKVARVVLGADAAAPATD
jgi:cytoskeleton protein RodZ